jgi:hypothetical protein
LTNTLNENPQKELPTTYLNFTEFLPLVVPFNIGPMMYAIREQIQAPQFDQTKKENIKLIVFF